MIQFARAEFQLINYCHESRRIFFPTAIKSYNLYLILIIWFICN